MEAKYDVIIIGCGPAGLAAGLYAGRSRLKALLLGRETAGGQMRSVGRVENYPGFPDGISGAKLGLEMMKQAMKYGLQFKLAEVEGIELQEGYKVVKARIIRAGEATYLAKTVIIAGGAIPRRLGVPGENKFAGRGVSYCGVCDAPQFAERVIAVVGGGDVSLTEALHLSKFASRVIVIHRRQKLRAAQIIQERALAEPKIVIYYGTKIVAITGDDHVKELELLNILTDERTTLPAGGILIRIGLEPNTNYLKGLLSLDNEGYILVNDKMETSVPGVFAAGDIRHASARQIASAVGDGVAAAISAGNLIIEY